MGRTTSSMRQLVFLVAGGAAMLFLMHLNPAMLQNRRVVYGALAVVALGLIVALFQSPINGTHRWIQLPWFQLQPSEFAKPADHPLHRLVSGAGATSGSTTSPRRCLPLGFILALVAGLVLLGRDFGTAMTLVLVAAGMIYRGGPEPALRGADRRGVRAAGRLLRGQRRVSARAAADVPQSGGRSARARASTPCSR